MLGLLGLPSAGSIARAIVSTAIGAVMKLVADGVKSLLDALFGFIGKTTEPVFTSGWWTGDGHVLLLEVLAVSGSIMVDALMLAALEGIWSGTTAPMTRALGAIPAAVIKTVALVSIVSALVNGADQIAKTAFPCGPRAHRHAGRSRSPRAAALRFLRPVSCT